MKSVLFIALVCCIAFAAAQESSELECLSYNFDELPAGQAVDTVLLDEERGLRLTTQSQRPLIAFDTFASAIPELGSPNQACPEPGPGVGEPGGPEQPGANCEARAIVAVVSDGNAENPMPAVDGDVIIIENIEPNATFSLNAIGLLNVVQEGSTMTLHMSSNDTAAEPEVIPIEILGANSFQLVALNRTDLIRVELTLVGAVGIDEIDFCVAPVSGECPCDQLEICKILPSEGGCESLSDPLAECECYVVDAVSLDSGNDTGNGNQTNGNDTGNGNQTSEDVLIFGAEMLLQESSFESGRFIGDFYWRLPPLEAGNDTGNGNTTEPPPANGNTTEPPPANGNTTEPPPPANNQTNTSIDLSQYTHYVHFKSPMEAGSYLIDATWVVDDMLSDRARFWIRSADGDELFEANQRSLRGRNTWNMIGTKEYKFDGSSEEFGVYVLPSDDGVSFVVADAVRYCLSEQDSGSNTTIPMQ